MSTRFLWLPHFFVILCEDLSRGFFLFIVCVLPKGKPGVDALCSLRARNVVRNTFRWEQDDFDAAILLAALFTVVACDWGSVSATNCA